MNADSAPRNPFATFSVLALLLSPQLCPAQDWPQWRGPQRSGQTEEADLPLTWDGPKRENVLWKVPVDFGHSSPIISGGRIFLTASVRKVPKASGQTAENQQHRAACYRAADGMKLWQTDIEPGSWDTEFSFTAATPVTDGKNLYALYGSGTVAALDLDGKLLWQKKLPGPFKAEWLSSSPVLHHDTLFIVVDTSDAAWLMAIDKNTGNVKWEIQRKQHAKSHNAPPLIIPVKDKFQIIIAASGAVIAFDCDSGEQAWTCKSSGTRDPSLIALPGLVYATGEGGESLAIDPTGQGDVSKTHIKWHQPKSPQGFGAPILAGDLIYRASPPGIIRCWNAADGQLVFEEPVPGVPTYTSPILTKDGRIYFAGPGKTTVIQAGPKLQVLAQNDLGEGERNEGGQTGPSAAISGGRVFLRGPKSLSCIGKKP